VGEEGEEGVNEGNQFSDKFFASRVMYPAFDICFVYLFLSLWLLLCLLKCLSLYKIARGE